jgi:hypothetical protein
VYGFYPREPYRKGALKIFLLCKFLKESHLQKAVKKSFKGFCGMPNTRVGQRVSAGRGSGRSPQRRTSDMRFPVATGPLSQG